MRRLSYAAVALMAGGILFAGPALADSIDGNWCATKGVRFLSIDGPKMVTPGGKSIAGHYSRHDFVYTAPAGEIEAGKVVNLHLVNEQTVLLEHDGLKEPEVWLRCASRPVA